MSRKSVFITGAAAGIGRAIAMQFYRSGYVVGLYDIDASGVESLAVELGERCVWGVLDVVDESSWHEQLERFLKLRVNGSMCSSTTPGYCLRGLSNPRHLRVTKPCWTSTWAAC